VSWLSEAWNWYTANAATVNPIGTFVGALGAFVTAAALAWAAIRQARTATRQAEIAGARHQEQTEADRERRITENFSKAVEQLASDKIELRLGGIYTLERISRESPDDYWTVMETLTAFVREHAPWTDPDPRAPESMTRFYEDKPRERRADSGPSTDIAAGLSVIVRRSKQNRQKEKEKEWRFDFTGADLRGADLVGAHLEGACLHQAHLERARLSEAHLEGAWLVDAHLVRAHLLGAHLDGANLRGARLEGAYLMGAHLDEADLDEAHLEGADLRRATGLVESQLTNAYSDAETRLPEGVAAPMMREQDRFIC
jgi:Pentapeptide repeats (8 copies)